VDAPTIAATIAELVLRSDGASFVIASSSASPGESDPATGTLSPATVVGFSATGPSARVRWAWSATYRGARLSGSLVADVPASLAAEGALLAAAVAAFDATDVRLTTLGTTLPIGSTLP
jgi:hypothetical protein